jgi:hypothetical protein
MMPVTGYAERSTEVARIELTYPAVKSIDENAIVFISDELLSRFFEGSEFDLKPVILPANFRILSAVREKKIDINLFPKNDSITNLIPKGLVTNHSHVFFSTPLSLFALREQQLSDFSLDQLSRYHLGIPSGIPEAVISAYLSGASAAHYSSYYDKHQMVKALATRRVDIVLSEAIGIYQALDSLNFRNKVERIIDLDSTEATISIRSSIPPATQERIWAYVDKRIKTFDQRRVIEDIFNQYDFNHDVIKIP